MYRYRAFFAAALVGAVWALPQISAAQSNYPSRPVRIIVPTGAGGSTDSTARNVAEFLSKALRQPFIVENKPGALGRVAATYLVQQAADGYTLFMMANSQSVLPALYELPYDTLRDFTPIAVLSFAPSVLLVNKDLPASTVAELVAYARSHPQEVTFGFQGGPLRLAGAEFSKLAGLNAVGVPFNSSTQALSELVAGRLTYLLASAEVAKPQVEAGTVRALAAVGARRASVFPDVPSLYELNYQLDGTGWFGLTAPRDLPQPIIERLYSVLKDGYFGKAPQQVLMKAGLEPAGEGPEQFRARLASSIARWQDIAQSLGIERTKL